jgi:hypothetical protein
MLPQHPTHCVPSRLQGFEGPARHLDTHLHQHHRCVLPGRLPGGKDTLRVVQTRCHARPQLPSSSCHASEVCPAAMAASESQASTCVSTGPAAGSTQVAVLGQQQQQQQHSLACMHTSRAHRAHGRHRAQHVHAQPTAPYLWAHDAHHHEHSSPTGPPSGLPWVAAHPPGATARPGQAEPRLNRARNAFRRW